MQYDRSLLTGDIIGAQPKHRNIYLNRLLPNQLTQEEQIRLQQQMPHQDIRYGRRRYENDVHHFCNISLPQDQQYRQLVFDRLLNTKDIDGAVPGSLQSQAVRNQEIAKKIRLERVLQNKSCNHSQMDEFTKEENYLFPQRDRSHTFQTSPFQKNSERSSQLPPIQERISDTIDHVANKLQLRQHPKNFQLEDYKQKNKQALLKLYI